jgi:hypothetical protein
VAFRSVLTPQRRRIARYFGSAVESRCSPGVTDPSGVREGLFALDEIFALRDRDSGLSITEGRVLESMTSPATEKNRR